MRVINGLPEKDWRKQWWAKYHSANGEKIRARQRDYYARNKERMQANRRAYVENNKEKVSEANRDWYKKNRVAASLKQRERVARKHKLSLLDIENMLLKQGGGCAICSTTKPEGRGTWHIDHDHKTGSVRGLLCHSCNVALGHMDDDPHRLRKAAQYLESAK